MANNEGTPLHGDRGVWNVDDFADEHAKDIQDASWKHHVPEQLGNGHIVISDGTKWASIPLGGDLRMIDGMLTISDRTERHWISADDFRIGYTDPAEYGYGDYDGYKFTIGDDKSLFNWILPLNWKSGTDIKIVVYWYIQEGGTADVQWEINWSATPFDKTESIYTPTDSGIVNSGDIAIPTTAYYLTYTEFVIAASNLSPRDLLGFQFSRETIDDGQNPSGAPIVIGAEIEHTVSGLGPIVEAMWSEVAAQSSITGDLTVDYDLGGTVAGELSVTGTLAYAKAAMKGTVAGLATVNGRLNTEYVAGSSGATSSVSGNLTVTP